ncbi:flagellin [Pacificibacter maritimus]|nr:flagellin [Pacificibacter maritimus]
MRLVSQTKQDLERYNYEVASGKKSDLRQATSADFAPLASIERSLRSLSAYENALTEAELFTSSLQTVLGTVSDQVSSISTDILTASSTSPDHSNIVVAKDARSKLDTVVATLNTRVGGRSLLAGTATGGAALVDAQTMLDEVTTLASAELDAAGVLSVVDDWFDAPGGGFETSGYLGSDTNLSPFALNEHQKADLSIKADDESIRDTLKGLVLAALIDQGIMGGDIDQQNTILQKSGETLLAADAKLTNARAEVGTVEQQISQAKLSNSAESYGLEMAKSKIVSVDIYDSAAKLTQAQAQLEMIYTITARLSNMKLSDYI